MASLFTRLQWSFRTIFTYMIIYSLSRSACPLLITFAGLSHSSRHASQRASFCGQLAMSRFKQKGVSIQCFRLESLLPKPQTSFTFWAIRLTWLSGHKSVDAQFQYKSLFKYNTPNPLQTWREFQRTDTDSPKPLASQPTASKKLSCQRFPSFPQHLVGFFGSQMVNGMSMVCQWYVNGMCWQWNLVKHRRRRQVNPPASSAGNSTTVLVRRSLSEKGWKMTGVSSNVVHVEKGCVAVLHIHYWAVRLVLQALQSMQDQSRASIFKNIRKTIDAQTVVQLEWCKETRSLLKAPRVSKPSRNFL